MKKTTVGIVFILLSFSLPAQQIGMYSHFFLNPVIYNPSFTGYHGTNATLISREQWSDFSGAPRLNIFTLDGSIMNEKAGLGVLLISDRKGMNNRLGGSVSYAYRLKLGENSQLRFGIAAGVVDQTMNYSQVMAEDLNDPSLYGSVQRKTTFDANAGLAFIWKGLEIGVGVPQVIGNRIEFPENQNIRAFYTQTRHIMGSASYRIPLSSEKGISLTPLAIVRYVPGAPFQYDGNLNFDWQDKFWIGATYKSNYAVAANAGFCILKQFKVGYSYDFMMGGIGDYSAGTSHEIMLSFHFGKGKKDAITEEALQQERTTSQNKLDSLGTELQISQNKASENERKITELNDKLAKQAQALQQAQNALANNAAQQPANSTSTGTQSPVNNQTPDNQTPSNASGSNKTIAPATTNQNAEQLKDNPNKVMESGVWFVTSKTNEFKDTNNHSPQKGYYVIAGTFFYRDFAEAEVQRLIKRGFKGTNWVFFGQKQFNYVFIARLKTKEEALKKVDEAKKAGILDAWIQILVE